jgi:hypothetical protein
MKQIFFFLLIAFGYAPYLLGQTNPVTKSLCIYLKKIEKQKKIDTLFVFYDSPDLQKYHTSKIDDTKIIEVDSYQPNQTIIKLGLEDFDRQKIIVLIEQVSKWNNKTNDLNIFTSAVMHIEFRVKKGNWKYKSQKTIKI